MIKKVAVVVLSWNKEHLLQEVFESLSNTKVSRFKLEVVVVDNGSNQKSLNVIKNYIRNKSIKRSSITWKLIENKKNLGFAAGNNIGIRYALVKNFDYVVLLNDDALVDSKCLENLFLTAESDKLVGAISPKIYFFPGYEFHKQIYGKSDRGRVIWYAGGDIDWNNIYGTNHGVDKVDKGQFDMEADTGFATGCCVLFTRKAMLDCGLFDERYNLYLEDMDLSVRLKKKGYRVIYSPRSVVWHKVAQSSGIGSDLNDYYITRNRMLFGFTYGSTRTKFALIRESVRFLFFGRKWQRIGIVDFYLQNFGNGSWKTKKN